MVVVAILVGAATVGSQQAGRPVTSRTADATRAQLTRRLDSLSHLDSTVGKVKERRARNDEIAALRARLTQGDFKPGDRFLVDYGDPSRRPDTVLVRDSVNFALVNWPAQSLYGVLRSELQGRVEKYVGTYLREPRIRVYPLIRLVISGGVPRPGVYSVDPERTLSDALMDAGGTGASGKPDKITVQRDGERVLDADAVQTAFANGTTIEALGLQAGDEIRVPAPKSPNSSRLRLQNYLWGITIVTAIIAFIRASYTG